MNLDGDVLLHNDINMYNIQPKTNFNSLAEELKEKINKVIDEVVGK